MAESSVDKLGQYYNRTKHSRWLYRLTNWATLIFCHTFWRVEVYYEAGVKEAIRNQLPPFDEGVILAPKHRAAFDPWVIGTFVWNRLTRCRRPIWFLTKAELFSNPVVAWFISRQGAYPVKRAESDLRAYRTTRTHLESGEVVMIFPEGTRNPDMIGVLKNGIASIAQRTQAPVLPIMTLILGRFWRQRIIIYVAKPLSFNDKNYGGQSGERAQATFLHDIRTNFEQLGAIALAKTLK